MDNAQRRIMVNHSPTLAWSPVTANGRTLPLICIPAHNPTLNRTNVLCQVPKGPNSRIVAPASSRQRYPRNHIATPPSQPAKIPTLPQFATSHKEIDRSPKPKNFPTSFNIMSTYLHCPLPTGHWSLVTAHWPLLTGHWSLVTAHRSPIIVSRKKTIIGTPDIPKH
jgi:hypothetical protein